jgi:hypothetical protein
MQLQAGVYMEMDDHTMTAMLSGAPRSASKSKKPSKKISKCKKERPNGHMDLYDQTYSRGASSKLKGPERKTPLAERPLGFVSSGVVSCDATLPGTAVPLSSTGITPFI